MQLKSFIDFSKYKRFFAFGCSFTDYKWPMWPEMIAKFIPDYYNFGCAGGDNKIIYNRIIEADCIYNFDEQDLILVMWTNIWRDTYFDPVDDGKYIRLNKELKFNQFNFMFRDFCFFKSCYHFLEHKKVDYDFLSMSGYSLDLFKNFHLMDTRETEIKKVEQLLELFSNPIKNFKSSMFENVYNLNWNLNRQNVAYLDSNTVDNHPTPSMSLEYLKSIYVDNNFSSCIDYVEDYEKRIKNQIVLERIQPQNKFETIMSRHPLIFK